MHRLPLLLALALSLPVLASAGERKVVATKGDCEISVGDRDSRALDLIIADCTWSAPPARVIAVVKDATTHTFLSSVEVSTKLADGRVLQVHKADGIADRQVALTFKNTDLQDGGFRTEWTKATTQESLGEDRVEVEVNDGAWEVHAGENGGSKVRYELRYHAGGKVPNWLVRSFQKGGVGTLVTEMRDRVSR